MNDTSHLVVNHLRHPSAGRWNDVLRHESEDTVTDLSEFSFRLSRFKSLLSSCLYFTPCSCNNSWYDDSASDSLREFGQILWKITFSHLQDSMMDFCMAATLSTVLDNGTLNRTASDSSLCRRSSARHLSLAVWSPVPTLRSTLPTCIPSALLRTGHDGTFLGSLPVVSPVLRLLLWSYCGSATMLVSEGDSHSQRRVRSGFGCGPSTAFLANQAPVYCGCPAGTHGCDLVSRMRRDQSANPVGVWLGRGVRR